VQVEAWLALVQVKNKCEMSLPMGPPGVDKTIRLRLRDPVARGVKCGPHGGKNGKMKSWTVLVEPQNLGRVGTMWEPRHEWRLAEATPSSWGFQWFTRKPLGSLFDPQSQNRRTEDGGAAASDRSDWWDWPVWPVCDDAVWRLRSGGHASGSRGLRQG
jgi:hypothetical protein